MTSMESQNTEQRRQEVVMPSDSGEKRPETTPLDQADMPSGWREADPPAESAAESRAGAEPPEAKWQETGPPSDSAENPGGHGETGDDQWREAEMPPEHRDPQDLPRREPEVPPMEPHRPEDDPEQRRRG
jgi:hypothetical protein